MGRESVEFIRMISRDLNVKVIFELIKEKGVGNVKVWSWNILDNKIVKCYEVGEGCKEG